MGQAWPALAEVRGGVIAVCAVAIILSCIMRCGIVAAFCCAAGGIESGAACRRPSCEEEVRLAKVLRHHLEVLQVHREPELKVVELARRIDTAEHKLSRLITQALGEKNFNQMINRHRIAYACRRLAEPATTATILDISADAGFASLGAYNRAFKAATGCTPSAYRAICRARATAVDVPGEYRAAAPLHAASWESAVR